MPEQQHPDGALRIVANLRMEVGDERGRTRAHLRSEPRGLVLDVDEPSVLLRAVPGRGMQRDLRSRIPSELRGTAVRLSSQGRDLGRAEVSTSGDAVRFRPTLVGVWTAARAATSYGTGRAIVWGVGTALGGVLVASALRRRQP